MVILVSKVGRLKPPLQITDNLPRGRMGLISHAYLLYGMQAIVANQIQVFKQFRRVKARGVQSGRSTAADAAGWERLQGRLEEA